MPKPVSATATPTTEKTTGGLYKSMENMLKFLNNYIGNINNSKIFAGLMIIILNVSSKFVSIKLSKSMESYLKHTFSRNILIFAIAWMGTREIYVAIIITALFILCMDYIFNEDSWMCCLPEHFTDYHISLLENVSEEEYTKALATIEKYKKQKKSEEEEPQNKKEGVLPNGFLPLSLSFL